MILARTLPIHVSARTLQVQLHEVIETPDKVMLVMEYAATGDLLDYINRNGSLSEDEACKLFRQMLAAVKYSHDKGVIHRDLKCENMLLDGDGDIKVSDFGFAISIPNHDARLNTHCGSYAYAAPEILMGEKYDGRASDVWSMGVILYAMTCGRLPYDDKSMKVLMAGIRRKLTMPRSMSESLRDLVPRLLTVDAATRITMREALEHPWCKVAEAAICIPNNVSQHSSKEGRDHSTQEFLDGSNSKNGSGSGSGSPRISPKVILGKSRQNSPVDSAAQPALPSRATCVLEHAPPRNDPSRHSRPVSAVSSRGRVRGSMIAVTFGQQQQQQQLKQQHNQEKSATAIAYQAASKPGPLSGAKYGNSWGFRGTRTDGTASVSLPPVAQAKGPGHAVIQSLAVSCREGAQSRRATRAWSWRPGNMAFWRHS